MNIKVLDTVVLDYDLPKYGLRSGDLGAVVEALPDSKFLVEFVVGSGQTRALVELTADNVRPVGPDDMPSVRSLGREPPPAHL